MHAEPPPPLPRRFATPATTEQSLSLGRPSELHEVGIWEKRMQCTAVA